MLSSLLRDKESAETPRCRSGYRSSVSKQRNSKGEQAKKTPFLKALGERNPRSSMHSTMLLVFPHNFLGLVWCLRTSFHLPGAFTSLFRMNLLVLSHSLLFTGMFMKTLCSCQLTPCSATSWSNRAKTDRRVQKLFGRGAGPKETHTEKLQEVSFFSRNQGRNQFSPFVQLPPRQPCQVGEAAAVPFPWTHTLGHLQHQGGKRIQMVTHKCTGTGISH